MNPFFKKGARVLFTGDSVTDCDRDRGDEASLGNGYPQKVAGIYAALFPDQGVTFLNRAVSGDTTEQMLSRYDTNLKAVAPDFVSIMIGVNDTWRRFDSGISTTPEQTQANLEEYLQRIRQDFPQVGILLMEPLLLPSDPQKRCFRADLDPKIEKIRDLAVKYADYYIPTDGLLHAASVKIPAQELSADGVHPLEKGHAVIARIWLKCLGIL